MSDSVPQVAVVGAGLAGLACAGVLRDAGVSVRVFDKGRAPGGRASTRRADGLTFDHGAQYFTARGPAFRRVVADWRRRGLVAPWEGRLVALADDGVEPVRGDERRYVGVPRMSAVARALSVDLDVRSGARVERLAFDGGWSLELARPAGQPPEASGPFAHVVISLPAEQARALAPPGSSLPDAAADVRMLPCLAVMLASSAPLPVDFDGAFVEDSALSWIARDGSKPGRCAPDTWVLHAGPDWSAAHAEDDGASVVSALQDELARVVGVPLPGSVHAEAHLWRYAQADTPLDEGALVDALPGLTWAGDWCAGSRVEGAWTSGVAAATGVLRALRS